MRAGLGAPSRIHVCTDDTRTLPADDDTSRLIEELGSIDWHVVGLCKIYR